MASAEQHLTRAWYSNSWWLVFLIPFSWLFRLLTSIRRSRLQSKHQGHTFSSPVVIVGNISVGGSGKTPLIIAIVKALSISGFNVGVVSRGYGGKADSYPLDVVEGVSPAQCGDEPLLIAQSCDCPVVVDPDRVAAVNYLLANHSCDLVLSDDGLQHYRLHRDIEIAVVDGARGLGNQRCLPAGPLRESSRRLQQVDFVLVNGETSNAQNIFLGAGVKAQHIGLQPSVFRNLSNNKIVAASEWAESSSVHAVAAIGNPDAFAGTLRNLGLDVDLTSKDDHQQLYIHDLSFNDSLPVIITAKDAIKYTDTIPDNLWVLEVEMNVPPEFVDGLIGAAGLLMGATGLSVGAAGLLIDAAGLPVDKKSFAEQLSLASQKNSKRDL